MSLTAPDRIAEGDYFGALDLAPAAEDLQIHLAAATVGQRYPPLAAQIDAIAQVLTDPARREIYVIVTRLRDDVMATMEEEFGADPSTAISGCRALVWSECQAVLKCDFEKADVRIQPRGADSIARRGKEWVRASVLNGALMKIRPESWQRDAGAVRMNLQLTTCTRCGNRRTVVCPDCGGTGRAADSETLPDIPILISETETLSEQFLDAECTTCSGAGSIPCDCQDVVDFRLPKDGATGALLTGIGLRFGRLWCALLDGPITVDRPSDNILYWFYRLQQSGMVDYTLEDLEKLTVIGPVVVASMSLIATVLIALLLRRWFLGLVVGITWAASLILKSTKGQNWDRRRTIIWALATSITIAAVGVGVGWRTHSQIQGIVVGALPLVGIAFMFVMSILYERIVR